MVGLVAFRSRRGGWGDRLVALVLAVLVIGVPMLQYRVSALSSRWPEERERRIESASRRLEGDLREELRRIVEVAERTSRLVDLPDDDLFHAMGDLIPSRGVEMGVVVLSPSGVPRAWAGRHRVAPEPAGDSLAVRFAPYLSVFETRRTLADGFVVVASLLLDADPAVPGADASLSERFRARTEVGLEIFPAEMAPENGDIFDYEEPTTAGPRVLFSVRPRPPTQGEATEHAVELAGQAGVALALTLLLAGLLAAPGALGRYAMLGGLFYLVVRAPALDLAGLHALASPALFYRDLPLGIATVAGPLLVSGLLLTALGVRLWRGPGRRPPLAVATGLLLLLGAPYLVRALGQGITPPVRGVSIPLWLSWEVTLLLATAGLVVVAAGLTRRPPATSPTARWPLVGAALAVAAGVVGVYAWEGRSGWPEWYTFLWVPALLLVIQPAARWATILGIAAVAGSAAALMTWGAELEGRVELARRDLIQLGQEPELLAEPTLRAFAATWEGGPPTDGAPGLFARWRRSDLDRQGYPTRLELRRDDGTVRAAVVLDQLDLPDSLVSAAVRALPSGRRDTVVAIPRTPGLHYLLVQRLAPDTVLAVALGPRSLLVPPARLGRLLRPAGERRPAYRISLSQAAPLAGTEVTQVRWRREGWTIRGERTIQLPDGPRQAFASVDMLRPGPLLIRGALVLLANIMVLALLWRVAELMAGDRLRWPVWRSLIRSFRAQLFLAMSAFFVLPVGGVAVWSLVRLSADAQRGREAAVTQVLRDVLAAEPELDPDHPELAARLANASRRVDAELGVYRGGRLLAETTPVLGVFGLLSPFMDPDEYHHIRLAGERDGFATRPAATTAGLVGYRSFVAPSSTDPAVLASPRSASDPGLAERQLDLALALLLASLTGVLAALLAARLAARRLSQPVSDLRRAALAFGEGRGLVPPERDPPVELEPVFAAFQKMADDVRANQEAQERAARVLAWGEMASQVAHEIKNPLTPMRLGIQHLQRVWRDRQERFGPALEETAPRVLAEIDRLDQIARSFSRYGAPAEGSAPLERVDLAQELAEVVPLYRVGAAAMEVEVATMAAGPVRARRGEVKEVLLNLLENARDAGARRVVLRAVGRQLTVQDDGRGMSGEMLDRIFEPRFSTTTSGSGLGLAIVRRIVEGWGGAIGVQSEPGHGATFTIRFADDESPGGQGGGTGPDS